MSGGRPWRRTPWVLGIGLVAAFGGAAPASAPEADRAPRAITALGRLEPGGGVLRLAGPSGPAQVVERLLVQEGDRLAPGQAIAVLDSFALRRAELDGLEAELEHARLERRRKEHLIEQRAASEAALGAARLAERVAEARVEAARARLERSLVRAPVSGRVLSIGARSGERLGPEGLVEIGETDRMYAVAEIYETDVAHVREGQRARVRSPVFGALHGTVESLGFKIHKADVLGSDPVAKVDSRVVEARIRLQPRPGVERFTNLQVVVEIEPDPDVGQGRATR